MQNRKFPALIALIVAFAALTIGSAGATTDSGTNETESATLTAAVTDANLDGTRLITSVAGSTELTSGQVALLATADATVLEGALPVEVTESAAVGKNPWSVAVSASDLTGDVSLDVISNANLSVKGRSVTVPTEILNAGVTASSPGTTDPLSSEQTLYTISNQDPATLYTGLYVSTATIGLTIPDVVTADTYTGTITVTLYDG